MSNTLSPLDTMFLWGESPDNMLHVAGLLPFVPPQDAPPDHLRRMLEESHARREIHPPWNLKLRHPRLRYSPVQSWTTDRSFDLDYHVRRSALASPGDERELGILVSRLHSHQLDFSRPPWEMHLIEGLSGGRFAIYLKIHHALIDGYTGMKTLVRSLSTTPEERDKPLFFEQPLPVRARPKAGDDADSGFLADLGSLSGAIRRQAGSGLTLASRLLSPSLTFGDQDLVGNLRAPRCILNARIGRNRRFATQQYELAVLKQIGAARGATINDVFVAIVGGALRRYLGELGELPDRPLVAFLPVNVRASDDAGGGNAVGAILASLATDVADPLERLDRVAASTRAAKARLEGMTQEAILAYSATLLAPSLLQAVSAVTGVRPPLPVTFNLCVSNVPGPGYPLYLRGSRLEAAFPVSIPIQGMALNVTIQSYSKTLCVGFTGDRDAVPHLQRLAVMTGEALAELETAADRS